MAGRTNSNYSIGLSFFAGGAHTKALSKRGNWNSTHPNRCQPCEINAMGALNYYEFHRDHLGVESLDDCAESVSDHKLSS